MVNAIQTGSQWVPNNPPDSLKKKSVKKMFTPSTNIQDKKHSVFKLFGSERFTISDAVDIVNPLQHLPVIGPLYREFTGDHLDPFSRIAGNTLFFGVFGAAFSSFNVALEKITGKDVGSNVITIFKNENINTAKLQTTFTNREDRSAPTIVRDYPIDPVLAWATAEIKHRNSEALKQGIELPTRPYSTLVASTTSSMPHSIQATTSSTRPKSIKITQRSVEHVPAHAQKSIKPVPQRFFALNTLNHDLITTPTTLQEIKRGTNAYTSLATHINQFSDKNPANNAIPKSYFFTTSQTQPHTAISKNNGWFSPSMKNALSKYHQAKNPNLLSDNARSSLKTSLR